MTATDGENALPSPADDPTPSQEPDPTPSPAADLASTHEPDLPSRHEPSLAPSPGPGLTPGQEIDLTPGHDEAEPASFAAGPPTSPPRGLFGAFNELLTRPLALAERAHGGGRVGAGPLFAGALGCYVLYGVAAGSFAGGQALLLAAVKVPLVIACTFVLCLPSLYVFGAMAGIDWSARRLLAVAGGFAGTLGLLLAGLMPVAWLFSVSSRYLGTAVWLHVVLWLLTVAFGWRFLRLTLRQAGAQGIMFPWLLLFVVVSFQVATFLRPVLARDPGEGFFVTGKLSMFENLGRVGDQDDATRNPPPPAPAPPPPATSSSRRAAPPAPAAAPSRMRGPQR